MRHSRWRARKSCGNPHRNRQAISFASRRTVVSKQSTLSSAPGLPNKKQTKLRHSIVPCFADLTRCLFFPFALVAFYCLPTQYSATFLYLSYQFKVQAKTREPDIPRSHHPFCPSNLKVTLPPFFTHCAAYLSPLVASTSSDSSRCEMLRTT